MKLLKKMGLEAKASSIRTASGGQQQRVSIARAMALSGNTVFDEPTSALTRS